MFNKFFEIAGKTVLILSLIATGFAVSTLAQGDAATASASTQQVKKAPSPKEELMTRLRSSMMKGATEYVGVLAEFLNKYPYDAMAQSWVYSMNGPFRNEKDSATVKKLIYQLIKETERIPPGLRAEVYRRGADVLFSNGRYAEAVDLSQTNLSLLNEPDYIDFRRRQFEEMQSPEAIKEREKQRAEMIKNNPDLAKRFAEAEANRKPPEFDLGRAKSDFTGLKTSAYNTIGKSSWELDKFPDSEKAFRDSYAVKISKESALGIAKAAEKNGNRAEALKYATVAALTGKLTPREMEYFHSLYAKQNGGKTDGIEEYLDAEFKKTYVNPVKGEKYQATAKRSDRTVLVEFVTGSGCVPCIPYDYTFERVLEDFSPTEIAIVVYHTHAPTMDPLGNFSSDSRYKYYQLNGAPNVFIDGKKFDRGGSYNSSEDDDKIPGIAAAVYADLKSGLEVPADAKIKLTAKRDGQQVSISAEPSDLKNVSDDVTLHVALVEKETAYSGENGLRFHFNVVRALAGDNAKRQFGFKVDPSKSKKFEHVFDVDRIMAQNLIYYPSKTAEMLEEFIGRMGGRMPEGMGITFDFNYQRNRIDADHLSVIAYLQDNKTKKILQSTQVDLAKK